MAYVGVRLGPKSAEVPHCRRRQASDDAPSATSHRFGSELFSHPFDGEQHGQSWTAHRKDLDGGHAVIIAKTRGIHGDSDQLASRAAPRLVGSGQFTGSKLQPTVTRLMSSQSRLRAAPPHD